MPSLLPYPPHADPLAWDIIRDFATSDMSLPQAEAALQAHLGMRFVDTDWRPGLKAVMDAEGSVDAALEAIEALCKEASSHSRLKIRLPARPKPDQTILAEEVLLAEVRDLQLRNRIFGTLPTIDEMLDPAEEKIGEDWAKSDGSIAGIAEQVRREMAEANSEVVEIDNEDDVDEESTAPLSRADLIRMCQELEEGCMQYGDPSFSLALSHQLCKFRAVLRKDELLSSKQTSLDNYFS